MVSERQIIVEEEDGVTVNSIEVAELLGVPVDENGKVSTTDLANACWEYSASPRHIGLKSAEERRKFNIAVEIIVEGVIGSRGRQIDIS